MKQNESEYKKEKDPVVNYHYSLFQEKKKKRRENQIFKNIKRVKQNPIHLKRKKSIMISD
jgi:hypothetical protein